MGIRKSACVVMMFLFLVFPLVSQGGVPLDTVKTNVDSVLAVLRNSTLKGEAGKKAKADKIRDASGKLFDFIELSKRTLGANWNKLDAGQRRDFVQLYTKLLEDAYVDKITAYTDEKVDFTKEVPLGANTVEVQSEVKTKTAKIPIYYRVIRKDDGWKVYDVVIEGVSLITNYRTQFREILASKPPESLLETLRTKVGGK